MAETMPDFESVKKHAKAIRRHIITMLSAAGSGHPGGSLSAADIVSTIYFSGTKSDNDHFILSKGHAAPVLYAALCENGEIPEEELLTLRSYGSRLQGHPDCLKLDGVEVSTGSLGQGLSIACGMALGMKLNGDSGHVFVLLGDGECQEGQVWEAAMFASKYHLNNLIAIVDQNRLQIDGRVQDVMSLGALPMKFQSFGWNITAVDGHSPEEIYRAIEDAKLKPISPSVILAQTIKGKGVSFMEDQAGWHGKTPNAEQAEQALKELACDSEEED